MSVIISRPGLSLCLTSDDWKSDTVCAWRKRTRCFATAPDLSIAVPLKSLFADGIFLMCPLALWRSGHILCAVGEARYAAVYRVFFVYPLSNPDPSKNFS